MQQMTSRFFFYGYAAAIGGHMWRPEPLDIEVEGASALTAAGGISRSHIPGKSIGGFVSFRSASTLAEGRYGRAPVPPALATTAPRAVPPALPTTTTVMAEVVGLEVGRTSKLRVDLIRGILTSTNPGVTGEPPIQLGDQTVLQGISIDGHELRVSIDHAFYQRYDTKSKLVAACEDPAFVKRYEPMLMLSPSGGAAPVPGAALGIATRPASPVAPPSLSCKDLTYATVVNGISWASSAHPNGRISGHSLFVKDFGTIFFGEILVGANTRRLSMLRVEFGSPDEGDMDVCAMGKNGAWVP